MTRSSLRVSLLLWYTAVLLAVIGTFAGTVGYLLWRSVVSEVETGLRGSAAEFVQGLRPAGSGEFDLDLPLEYQATDGTPSAPDTYYAVWAPDGKVIHRSVAEAELPRPAGPGMRTREGRRELAAEGPGGSLILVGRDLSDAREAVRTFAGTAVVGGLLALVVSLVGGWVLIGRALAPVGRINRAAAAMAAGDLSARIAVARTESELEQVAHALNGAFDRLRRALDTQSRFTADASHELRTPLATMAAEVEWALDRPRTTDEYRGAFEVCRRATERMTALVDRLLTLARADHDGAHIERAPVDLEAVVRDALAMVHPLALRRGIAVESRCTPAVVEGDRQRLIELLTNLCTNAVEYNRDGGRMAVELSQQGADVRLRVSDSGVGIDERDLPRVFDRLYRADDARSRRSGGAGLGLSIARWVVQAHGGSISCRSTVGVGTEVLVELPGLVR